MHQYNRLLKYNIIHEYGKFSTGDFTLFSYGTIITRSGYRLQFQAFVFILLAGYVFAGLNSWPEISTLLVDEYIRLLITPSLFASHVQFMLDLRALDETYVEGRGGGTETVKLLLRMLHRAC
jgi:hypothetical protein